MSDYKAAYSDVSNFYINDVVPLNSIDQDRYGRSKAREEKFNENWKKQKVNLNEIVDKFVPENGTVKNQYSHGGIKYVFEGDRYKVICDKAGGYLRIYDKILKSYCKLDGTPSNDGDETHFKIKRREEM